MKTGKTRYTSGIGRTLLGAMALVVLIAFSLPQAAQANTAANAVITNSVSVSYAQDGGTAATASVDVTVTLVGSVAWGTAPSGTAVGSGDALSYDIDLTNEGNGTDTFTFTDATNQSDTSLNSLGSIKIDGTDVGSASITLFGTIASETATFSGSTSTIPVGYLNPDDIATDGTSFVYIPDCSDSYSVTGASDTDGNYTLDVTGDVTTCVQAGSQIGERVIVTYTATAGTLSAAGSSETHNHDLTVTGTSVAGTAAATANVTWTTTVESGSINVGKYVRNITDDTNGNTGTPVDVDGVNYYDAAGGVTGDILEYVLVVQNTAAAGSLSTVIATDNEPEFTTLQYWTDSFAGATGTGAATDVFAKVSDGTNSHDLTVQNSDNEDDGSGNNLASGSEASGALAFNIGAGNGNTSGAGGSIDAGETYYIYYRVEID